jgi:hypothetical protein
MAVLNYDLVSNLHLASITTQLHTMVAHIESMREMAILTPGDPESHWYDRFGSLRPPFAFGKSRHVPRSLRVAVVAYVILIVIVIIFFFAVVFLFVLFLVRLLAKENVVGCRPMRRVCVRAFWMHCGHGQRVRLVPCSAVDRNRDRSE